LLLQQYRYHIVFFLATIAYLLGLQVDVINLDSAQYASISQELFLNNNWLQIKHGLRDYLDKPPLLFWLSALSFKIFGVSNWAFKLPTFLFTVLGVYSTYRLALLYYSKSIALNAALILYTCQAYFLFTNDVRTDALLTACFITATWLMATYLEFNKWRNFIGAFVFIALGMLAKGPIALMIIVWTFGSQLLLTKWLLGLLIAFLILLPMSYGLYLQHGWLGVKFFYWTQSFGRITGESEWNNGAGYFFFTHNFLWAFLPFSVLAVYGLSKTIMSYIKEKRLAEYISISGFLLTFVALSLSKYKLPHYIFVTFPFAAILSAYALENYVLKQGIVFNFFKTIYVSLLIVCLLIITAIAFYIFPIHNYFPFVISIGVLLLALYYMLKNTLENLIVSMALISVGMNIFSNAHFYPSLMKYQGGIAAAKYARDNNIQPEKLYYFTAKNHDLEFYYGHIIPFASDSFLQVYHGWIYSEKDIVSYLPYLKITPKKIISFDNYNVQFLNWKFLNPETRGSVLKKVYLVEI
jgi:4-amino-4-deoxy-L-arabinose transferase-like glycosyltransferase